MKYPAELAAERMEKSAIDPITMALIAGGLALTPTITRGLNWLTGHDAKKKVRQSQAAAGTQQFGAGPGMHPAHMPRGSMPMMRPPYGPMPMMRPPRGPMPMMRMPHGPMPQGMLAAANGLHNYRAGQPGF